jgi:hypothetical protein
MINLSHAGYSDHVSLVQVQCIVVPAKTSSRPFCWTSFGFGPQGHIHTFRTRHVWLCDNQVAHHSRCEQDDGGLRGSIRGHTSMQNSACLEVCQWIKRAGLTSILSYSHGSNEELCVRLHPKVVVLLPAGSHSRVRSYCTRDLA